MRFAVYPIPHDFFARRHFLGSVNLRWSRALRLTQSKVGQSDGEEWSPGGGQR